MCLKEGVQGVPTLQLACQQQLVQSRSLCHLLACREMWVLRTC
jgi:hypothetical protein